MSLIRDFCNADLPQLARVWSEHWTAAESPPPVSTTIMERAILSRTFFADSELLVAEIDGRVEAWCHAVHPSDDGEPAGAAGQKSDAKAILCAICFTQAGLSCCDDLLSAAEERVTRTGSQAIVAGPLRDRQCGYVGLAPVGHGIGVPDFDVRASSLLSRHGYHPAGSFHRMVVTTAPYKPPVNREMMQLRRTTRTQRSTIIPQQRRLASAMSHLDIEHHQLVNHRSGDCQANVQLWLSDPEAQVMSCAEAIMDLTSVESQEQLSSSESFLIAAVVQTMATRCVFKVETVINAEHTQLQSQLETLQFDCTGRGSRWAKTL